jgi:predicted transcriptional regulator
VTAISDLDARILDLAKRFIEAFKLIEKRLDDTLGDPTRYTEFGQLLRLAEGDRRFLQYVPNLKRFAALRNVLSHEPYSNGLPVAAPLATTVAKIEEIRDVLLKPPTVGGFVAGQIVVSTIPDASIMSLIVEMRHRDFSQAPVIGVNGGIGLVTTNAFARWAADQLSEDGLIIADNATVKAVMSRIEPYEKVTVLSRGSELASAFTILREAVLQHTVGPTAVVVTNSGKAVDKILGVIVQADLMEMSAILSL